MHKLPAGGFRLPYMHAHMTFAFAVLRMRRSAMIQYQACSLCNMAVACSGLMASCAEHTHVAGLHSSSGIVHMAV